MAATTETHPEHCENGHPLDAGHHLVGWLPCSCAGGRGHRTVTCRTCGAVWHDPPHEPARAGSWPNP